MSYYPSIQDYVQAASDLEDKIKRIDDIITALEDAALKAAESIYVEEYQIDDGQSKIKNVYRSVEEIAQTIKGFLSLRQIYVSRLGGNITRLRDKFSNRCY